MLINKLKNLNVQDTDINTTVDILNTDGTKKTTITPLSLSSNTLICDTIDIANKYYFDENGNVCANNLELDGNISMSDKIEFIDGNYIYNNISNNTIDFSNNLNVSGNIKTTSYVEAIEYKGDGIIKSGSDDITSDDKLPTIKKVDEHITDSINTFSESVNTMMNVHGSIKASSTVFGHVRMFYSEGILYIYAQE